MAGLFSVMPLHAHLEFIHGDDEATALLARHGSLGVVLTLFQVGGQRVQLEHCGTPVLSVVTTDTQPTTQQSHQLWCSLETDLWLYKGIRGS